MVGGTYGKVLHIDLSANTIRVEYMPDDFYRLLVGGRAIIAYFLLRDLPPNTDPLSLDNLLIFAPGILQGTNLPGSGRHGVGGKSPLTGAIASSEAGGWFGHELKRTGFDAIIIHGKAISPVYICINDGEVEIRPADHLWGKRTAPVEAAIQAELSDDKLRIAQIGPAGENQVRYAAIMSDINRAAGRNGLGAVMGSKNLKAVAIRGTQRVPIVARKRVTDVAAWLGENYKTKAGWAAEGVGRGTQDGLLSLSHVGGLPTKNFSEPIFEHPELLSGERNYAMFFKGRDSCQACPINCKQVFTNEDEDPYRRLDPVYGGAEYEAMGAFGSICMVEDNLAVLKANELCNAYGLDAISTGMAIGFVMECFEHGVITNEDTDGLEYQWGNGDLMVHTVEMIAKREGFGDVIAEGVARMSERFGPETKAFNLTVKKQELPMHEPRLKHALGVGYAVAPVGADHMMNMHDTLYTTKNIKLERVNMVLEKKVDSLSNLGFSEEKMRVFYHELNWMHFQDCAISCLFYPYNYQHLADALSGVTGIEYSIHDILAVGERAQTLSRLFNLREGFTADDDKLPKRVMKAFKTGPIAGSAITEEDFLSARRQYYEMMAWDPDTGIPTKTCLQKLGLDELLKGENNSSP